MDGLSIFGLFAVTTMLVCYALESRSHWFILAFAAACGLGSAYGFLQGAWPFGVVEAIWSVIALRRWLRSSHWNIIGSPPRLTLPGGWPHNTRAVGLHADRPGVVQ
jgi:hypothetical protein